MSDWQDEDQGGISTDEIVLWFGEISIENRAYKNKVNSLISKLSSIEVENKKLKAENDSMKLNLNASQNASQTKAQETSKIARELEITKNTIKDLETRLSMKVNDITDKANQIQKLSLELKDKNKLIDQMTAEIQTLKVINSELESKLLELEAINKQLQINDEDCKKSAKKVVLDSKSSTKKTTNKSHK